MAIDTATGKEAPAEISSERVKDIFSTIAKKYERFNAISSFGAYKVWLAGMMKQAPISANDDVLDIAGGTGDVELHRGARQASASYPVHRPGQRDARRGPRALRRRRCRRRAGGFRGGGRAGDPVRRCQSYDAITMAYGIRNMPDRPRALVGDVSACSSRAAALVCLEFSTPPNAVWRALYNFYLKHLIPFWGGLITGDRDGFVYLSKLHQGVP